MTDRLEEFEPPPHLSESSRALWRELVPGRARSRGRLVLLTVALEAKDRADEARELIAAEGMVVKEAGAKMAHLHPGLRAEKEARQQFLVAWRELGLRWDHKLDGRS